MTHQNNNYNNYNNYNNNFNNNYNNQFNTRDELYESQMKTMSELTKGEAKLKSDIKFGVGVIIAIALIIIILLGALIFGQGKSDDNTNNTTPTPVETEKVVGNDTLGYVTVPINWQQYAPIDSAALMYSDPTQSYIIALDYADPQGMTIEQIAHSSAKNLMTSGFKEVAVNKATVAGAEAYRIDAFAIAANKWAITWIFKGEDGKVHIISFETPNTDVDFITIPQTFTLTKNQDNKKDTR